MKNKYWIFALITVFLWPAASVVLRLVYGSFSIFGLAALRNWVGAITLLVFCIAKKLPLPRLRDIPIFILEGTIGFALYYICFSIGFKSVTAATGNVIMASTPIFTALFAWLFLKERIKPLGWIATGISFSGILILILWSGEISVNIGILWVLASSLLTSAYNLIQRLLIRRYTALQSSAYSLFAGALVLTPFLPESIRDLVAAPPMVYAVIIFLGAISCGIGYLLWTKALSLAKRTADVTNFLYLPPFIAAILAFAFFREVPDWGAAIGGAVILFGLWLFEKKA